MDISKQSTWYTHTLDPAVTEPPDDHAVWLPYTPPIAFYRVDDNQHGWAGWSIKPDFSRKLLQLNMTILPKYLDKNYTTMDPQPPLKVAQYQPTPLHTASLKLSQNSSTARPISMKFIGPGSFLSNVIDQGSSWNNAAPRGSHVKDGMIYKDLPADGGLQETLDRLAKSGPAVLQSTPRDTAHGVVHPLVIDLTGEETPGATPPITRSIVARDKGKSRAVIGMSYEQAEDHGQKHNAFINDGMGFAQYEGGQHEGNNTFVPQIKRPLSMPSGDTHSPRKKLAKLAQPFLESPDADYVDALPIPHSKKNFPDARGRGSLASRVAATGTTIIPTGGRTSPTASLPFGAGPRPTALPAALPTHSPRVLRAPSTRLMTATDQTVSSVASGSTVPPSDTSQMKWSPEAKNALEQIFTAGRHLSKTDQEKIFNHIMQPELTQLGFKHSFPWYRMDKQFGERNRVGRPGNPDWYDKEWKVISMKADSTTPDDIAFLASQKTAFEAAAKALGISLA